MSASTVSFAALARTAGYVGVGFSPFGYMQGSIAALCRSLTPTPVCEERFLDGYKPSKIIEDPAQPHVSDVSLTQVDNFTLVEVRSPRPQNLP